MNKSLEVIDDAIKYFTNGLQERKIDKLINFVIVSDHGMTNIDPVSKVVFISDYINSSAAAFINNGPMMFVYPNNPNMAPAILSALKRGSEITNNFKVWAKEDIPDQLHYKNNDRIAPIVMLAEIVA